MSAARPVVLVCEGSDPVPLQWLKERAEVLEAGPDHPSFESFLSRADGLMVRTYTRVDDALLARAPRLKVVGRGGVGLERIDVAACARRGVRVVYTPDANTLAVADYVFAVMLRLVRQWALLSEQWFSPEEFKRLRNAMGGRQLDELTLGILGMGRVGRRVGHIAANGFGMRVIYNDIVDVSRLLDFPAEAVDKPALYRQCDVLSLHVDMRPGNENLVGREQIAQMKPSTVLINTSRGEVLDAAALAEALRGGKLAGAALDVYAPEPPASDFPLLNLQNVILTPHIASRTDSAMQNMSWVVRDVMAVLEGREPRYAKEDRG